jgi:hypothetical protein
MLMTSVDALRVFMRPLPIMSHGAKKLTHKIYL